MADLNVFNHGAFNMTSLSTAIQQAPYAPQLLGQLGIFTPDRVRTTTIAVEQKGGVLSLIPTSDDGSQTAVAVLFAAVDSTAAAHAAVITARDAEVAAHELAWPAGTTTPQKTAALAQLAAVGIVAR